MNVLRARRRGQPRAVDVRRRAARPGRAGRRGRLAPAGGRRRRRGRAARRACGARTATRSREANAAAVARDRGRHAARGHRRAGAATSSPGCATALLLHSGPPITWDRVCDPQRRALLAAVLFEGWAPDRAAADAAARARRDRAGARQRARPRRPDDRRLLAVDAGLGRRGRRRGARSRRSTRARARRSGSASATTSRSSGCASSATSSARGSRALLEHRGPIDVFDLAAQGLNMGDELHMRSQATGNLLIRDLAAVVRRARRRGVGALHRRQPPLLPEPDDGGGQVRVAGDRGVHGLERRLADLAQRHRRRHPARRHAGPLVRRRGRARRRRAAARGLRARRRRAATSATRR